MPRADGGANADAAAAQLANPVPGGIAQVNRKVTDAKTPPELEAFVDALLLGHGNRGSTDHHSPCRTQRRSAWAKASGSHSCTTRSPCSCAWGRGGPGTGSTQARHPSED